MHKVCKAGAGISVDAILAARRDTTRPVREITPPGIGKILQAVFTERIGTAAPCGECSKLIRSMNNMTPQQVCESIESIVADIASRAATKAPKWWQRIAVHADQALGLGQTERFVRECVLEAIRRFEEPP
jgi:hypothetical protein